MKKTDEIKSETSSRIKKEIGERLRQTLCVCVCVYVGVCVREREIERERQRERGRGRQSCVEQID